MKITNEFSRRLIKIRNEKGLTQERLAQKSSVSVPTISRYETGESSPNLETIEKLAEALGVHSSRFFVDDDNVPSLRILNDDRIDMKTAIPVDEVIYIPVYDIKSCAGNGTGHLFEDAEISQTIMFPAMWAGSISCDEDKRPFMTKIDGDSMAPYINEGSRVLISENPGDVEYISNGKTVVARYEQKLLVRGLFRETAEDGRPRITLRAWNKAYRDIVINEWDDFYICGTVLRVDDSNIPQDMI